MTKVAFIVNGGFESAMGHRAREFACRLTPHFDIQLAYRSPGKLRSIFSFLRFLKTFKPDVVYVFDISYSGVLAAAFHKIISRNALIIETGDAIYELARSTGSRGRIGLLATRALESLALKLADKIVVRGTFHKRLLEEKGIDVDVIQDGVDAERFAQRDLNGRKTAGLETVTTIGVVGSSVWSEKLQMCYGWELVETLRLLRDKPVKGIMIGDGDGISHLKERAKRYGIEDKILFWGFVPMEELGEKLSLIDICLSTQTNNIVGQVRTTGKLPLYMAAGRYILASDVGEASIVLEKEMLVPYAGTKDDSYPEKLANRINALLARPERISSHAGEVTRAGAAFDYSRLAERMRAIIDGAREARVPRLADRGPESTPDLQKQ